MPTSRIARSGRSAIALSRASMASSASATTSMSPWRSSSSFRPLRTMPWSSAMRTRMGSFHRQLDDRSRAALGADGQIGPDAVGALAHARQPEAAGARVGEAAAVVGHAQDRAAGERQLEIDLLGLRVLGAVGGALRRDAVDRELLVVGQEGDRPLAAELRVDPGAVGEVAHLGVQGGEEAVIVERGGAQLAGDVQELV